MRRPRVMTRWFADSPVQIKKVFLKVGIALSYLAIAVLYLMAGLGVIGPVGFVAVVVIVIIAGFIDAW